LEGRISKQQASKPSKEPGKIPSSTHVGSSPLLAIAWRGIGNYPSCLGRPMACHWANLQLHTYAATGSLVSVGGDCPRARKPPPPPLRQGTEEEQAPGAGGFEPKDPRLGDQGLKEDK